MLGDMSLVRIAELLLRTAVSYGEENGIEYSYFCLLSGQDYPLVPVATMLDELQRVYPKPLIDCTPWSAENWVGAGSSNCPWFFPAMRAVDGAMGRTPLRRLVKLPLMAANGVARRFSSAKAKLDDNGVGLYGGSAWWILPDDMVAHVLDVMGDEGSRAKYLPVEGVGCPEENYFQTLLMDSPFKDRIEVNPTDMVAQNCKTYANFNPVGRPFTGHPYIFTMADTAELKGLSSSHYFARKFDETVDSGVLDWIDAHLLNKG